MPQLITSTAQLQCDKGATPAQFTATSQQFVKAEEKLMATEADIAPVTNVPSFGICAITQKACIPAPANWQHTSPFTIQDQHKLTTDSFCACIVGGTIRFITSGHSGFMDSE